jgi:hypothetical protein
VAATTEPTGAYPDYLSLNGLASRWGPAIGVERDSLAKGILIAFAENEFDGLSIAEPLILVDPTNLRKFAVSKGQAKSLTGSTLEASMGYIAWVRTGYTQVHPSVLPAFAKARGLSMPRWLAEGDVTDEVANKGGRPDEYDWSAIESALEDECRLQESVPMPGHSDKDWRTKADAMRYVRNRFNWTDGGPADSTLKAHIGQMLQRIDQRLRKVEN